MRLKGHIQIGIPTGGKTEQVEIVVTDDLSGCCVIEIAVDLKSWARALASRYEDCTFNEWRAPNVGKRRENKIVPIADPDPQDFMKKSDALLKRAIKRYELQGWEGKIVDFSNHHFYDAKTKTYATRFTRWVDEEPSEAVTPGETESP